MNVLVYAGRGVSKESLHHTVKSLKNSIGGLYDIKLIGPDVLSKDPWEENCKLLVFPGGRDLPFMQDLNGPSIDRIRHFIFNRNGKFLGICAGAYFACSNVNFEPNTPIAVTGSRELSLCPATATGCLYPGFDYESDRGAHAVPLTLTDKLGTKGDIDDDDKIYIYYDGGCWFDFTQQKKEVGKFRKDGLNFQIGATYEASKNNVPAIVIGYLETLPSSNDGEEHHPSVILSGLHIEYNPKEMSIRQPILSQLESTASKSQKLWNLILEKLGLTASPMAELTLPSPTPLYMFFSEAHGRKAFLSSLQVSPNYSNGYLKCENLSFYIHEALPITKTTTIVDYQQNFDLPPYSKEPFIGEEETRPSSTISSNEDPKNTPTLKAFKMEEYPLVITKNHAKDQDPSWSFSPNNYYTFLAAKPPIKDFDYMGKSLLYAEYIPSTQTILSQNFHLASILPNGSIVLAGDQLSGKGRGQNKWLSSKGCLQFTMKLCHKEASTLALIQYLVGLAMVEAILGEPGYQDLQVKLKWPNDLYTIHNNEPLKLGGILVNSQTFDDQFILLIGFGINVHDTPWTRSLNDLIRQHNISHGTTLCPWNKELLLARFNLKFSELYRHLIAFGFPFELYYNRWMHSNQLVFLVKEQVRARIEGIDSNGFLIAQPHTDGLLGLLSPPFGGGGLERGKISLPNQQPFLLQPDGNSFDMMKNLIRRKT